MPAPAANAFTHAPIATTLFRTALPIVLLTSLNGLLTVADAMMLGAFAGRDALAAVTVLFPVSMLLIALATMVSSGMASVLARHLGAGRAEEARRSFAGAHGLAFAVCLLMMTLFAAFGTAFLRQVAGGSPDLLAMADRFLWISVASSPLLFLVSVHSDALRVEGRIGFMALAGLVVSVSNLAFNAVLIAGFGLGVAGSALGSALAQAVALAAILRFRAQGRAQLSLGMSDVSHWRQGWRPVLALGAPRSLSFIGIALGAAVTILAIRLVGGEGRDPSIAAYGVITRLMTFAYLPLLGLSLALQAVAGNNYGAGFWERANATLRLALVLALVYSALVELVLLSFRNSLGALFVDDPAVASEIARILPIYACFYVSLGPMMMVASYLQSIGEARSSAFLSLARTYLVAVPLTFSLPWMFGETGIWLAVPIADLSLVAITAATLYARSRSGLLAWGLFRTA